MRDRRTNYGLLEDPVPQLPVGHNHASAMDRLAMYASPFPESDWN